MNRLPRLSIVLFLPTLVASALLWTLYKKARHELVGFEGFDGMHMER